METKNSNDQTSRDQSLKGDLNIQSALDNQIFNAFSTILRDIKIWEGALCGSTTDR